MREINCNIIRDLLPSYTDQICSEDSRMLVEEHLAECEQCRTRLEMMKSTELTDGQGEQKRISYLKKVKRYYINFVLLVLTMAGDIWFMIQRYGQTEIRLCYVLFPLLLTAAYCLLPDSPPSARRTRLSGILVMVSILLTIYFSVMVYWGIQISRTGDGLFNIPLEKTGPFLNRQLMFIVIMQFVIFVASNLLIFGARRVNKCIYGLSITGLHLAAGYICILHNMSTVETFYGLLLKMAGYIILEGIVFSVAACLLSKKTGQYHYCRH